MCCSLHFVPLKPLLSTYHYLNLSSLSPLFSCSVDLPPHLTSSLLPPTPPFSPFPPHPPSPPPHLPIHSPSHFLRPALRPRPDDDGQMSAEEEEARRIAEMGKPILGEHSRLEVVIEESYEFKVANGAVARGKPINRSINEHHA